MRLILLLRLLQAMVDRSYLGERLAGFPDCWTWPSERRVPLHAARSPASSMPMAANRWILSKSDSALCVVKDARELYTFVTQYRWEASCCIQPSRN